MYTYTYICTCTHMHISCVVAVKQNTTEQGTERNGTEQSGMKWNRSERSREAQADCTAAACLLAHLGVLNLYVVSSTGSAISLSHWRDGRRRENQHNHGRDERNENKERMSRCEHREARCWNGWVTKRNEKRLEKEREGRKSGEIYLSTCGREIESRVGQPTTKTHPLHYAHRSRDLNVPLEMVVCSCTGKTHVVKVPGKNY